MYKGIGCNSTHIHTETEFLNIMKKEFTDKDWSEKAFHYQLEYKNRILPDDFVSFTLDDWLDYSGAGKLNS